MSPKSPLKPLLDRLKQAGFDAAYVRRVLLPQWWDDDMAEAGNGLYEAMNHIASRLGVSVAAVRGDRPIVLQPDVVVCHKLKKDTSVDDVRLAEVLALRAARVVSRSMKGGAEPIPDALTIRQQILDRGAPWVGFQHLLDWCWSNGIAVVHVAQFPKATKKPHGFAAIVDGHPIIVLCWNEHRSSWLLFHLAHELGHIALEHVVDGRMLVDEKIESDSQEAEEGAANAYALTLITGSPDRELHSSGRWPVRAQMVTAAREYGAKHRIDPGHVALNYSRTMTDRTGAKFFALAGAALKDLGGDVDAIAMIRDRLTRYLDWESLHDDSRDFLEQLTGMSA